MVRGHLIYLSIPGLRAADIERDCAPTLFGLANSGSLAELNPTFPCVTSSVQASLWTGTPPGEHGVIANGFFHRDRHEVEFWVGRNGVIQRPQIWEALRDRGLTSAVWHAQNIKDAAADFIVTPAPIHQPDGSAKLWCYSKPEGLYQHMLDEGLGHFPLQHYWGPMANIESTRWIFKAAAWLHERHRPNFHWIYVPHLDYAGQKFGPNSPQAKAALAELDRELGAFLDRVSGTTPGLSDQVLIAGEYAMTDVSGVVYPNRLLRQAGLLQVRTEGSGERLDLACSPAFALVDHQLAHVYVGSSGGAEGAKLVGQVRDLFTGMPGVAQVLAGADRHHVGLNHPRAGDVILISDDSHWFAYYWWLDDAAAPPFARTVDIHNKPGYDPVELFFDPATRGIPLDPRLVKGSHGVPATAARHHTALIGSTPRDLPAGACDVDLMQLCLDVVAG